MAHVLVPLAEGCEELEAITIIDLLRRAEITVTTAGLDPIPTNPGQPVDINADTDNKTDNNSKIDNNNKIDSQQGDIHPRENTPVSPIVASRGTRIIPDTTLSQALNQSYDMLVLPGGMPGSDHLDQDPRIHQLLKQMQADNKYTAAICAAPKVLANAQLLDGKNATSYPGVIDKMNLTETQICEQNVVVDGKVVTSRGPATAMEFALNLIELLVGKEKREEVANGLLWPSSRL